MRAAEMRGMDSDAGRTTGTRAPGRGRSGAAGRSRHGFTLVEMTVTLAVAAIIAAVTIPNLVTWFQSYKATERQADAELIYTTAQNGIARLKANGQLDDTQGSTTALSGERVTLASATRDAATFAVAEDAKAADAGISALSSDDGSHKGGLDLLVPNIADSLSRVGYSSMSYATGAHYVIEYDGTLGYVYRVFFSEDQITNERYQQAAAAAADHDDARLAELGISYYGGTTPKTFAPSDREAVRWIGYFEFSGTARDASVTGGYYYQIDSENGVDGKAVDRLHDGNTIAEGAVDSSDGTAYGILVSRSAVDNGSFTPPTDVYPTPYQVTISNEFGMEGVERDCYFYKLGVPSSSGGQQAKYTIEYRFYEDAGSDNYWTWSDDRTGSVGSTAQITNGDLDSLYNGQVRQRINDGYHIDPGRSSLSGVILPDGQLKLYVALVRNGGSLTSLPDPTFANGVGVWHPWSTASKDELKGLAFYVNQNFAACISQGTDAPTGSAANTYQVRTDDQLQHVGSPYGSTYQQPDTTYLTGSFYQTHDITIDQTWYPIGQDQAKGVDDGQSRFSGQFWGGYAGTPQDKLSGAPSLAAPEANGQTFTITLARKDDGSKFGLSDNPAYDTDRTYVSYGIFGYVTGRIGYASVSVGTADTGFDLAQTLYSPHYGTLVGDLVDNGSAGSGSVDHAALTIARGSSLRMAQGGQDHGYATDDAIVGGLCGYMGGNATIGNSSVSLADDGTPGGEARFELTATPGTNIQKTVTVGGLVGRASCSGRAFLSNCTVALDDDATLTIQGTASGSKQVSAGGLAGYVQGADQASVEACRLTVDNGTLRVQTPQDNANWNNPTYLGGLVGCTDGKMVFASPSVRGSGSVAIAAGANGVPAVAGGLFGYLHNASFSAAELNVGGDLDVAAASATKVGYAGGMVGQAESDDGTTLAGATLAVGGNETIANSVRVADGTRDSYDAHAGGLAGSLSKITLSDASVTVDGEGKSLSVSADNTHSSAQAGGMVGELEGGSSLASPTLTARTLSVTASDDDKQAISGGLVGRSAGATGQEGTITGASITVHGDANLQSTAASDYALSGLLAGQLDSTAVRGAAGTVTGSLRSTAESERGASARAAGLIAQFENGSSLGSPVLKLTGSGDLNVTAESRDRSSLAGGLVAYAASSPRPLQVTGAVLSVNGNLTATSNAKNSDDALSGGLAGQARSVGFDGPTLTVGGSLSSSAQSVNGSVRAGGLVGEATRNDGVDAATVSNATLSPTGGLTVNATVTQWGDHAYAGGLLGHVESTTVRDAELLPRANVSVGTTCRQHASAGGLVGSAERAAISRISLLEDAGASGKAVSVSGNMDAGGSSCVGGGFGSASGTSADNSYVATRNATLALSNKSGGNEGNTFTGGFAGYVTGGNVKGCYLSADIVSADNKGVSAFADHFDKSQLWADFAIATMADGSGNALGNGYAFSRDCGTFSGSSDWPAGDYAIVTDRSGATPYKFLGWEPEDRDISTPACVIYDAQAADPTPGTDGGQIGQRVNGAHPVSLAWLAGTAPYDDAYNQGTFDADNPYHYRNLVEYVTTRTDGAARYPYVMGNASGVSVLRDGSNPYPTSTRDRDNRLVGYGRWPVPPAATAAEPDASAADATANGATGGEADQGATRSGTDANAEAPSPGQSSNPAGAGDGSSGANALPASPSPAGSASSTGDNSTGGDGSDQ